MMLKSLMSGTAALLLSVTVLAQENIQLPSMPVDEVSKLITYEKVTEVAGAKEQLFEKALAWCSSYYKNPGDVIREQDMDAGKIVCKARYKIKNPEDKKGLATDAGNVMYTMTLEFKEGRYRCIITEINWKQQSYYPIERWQDTTAQSWKPEFAYYLQQVDETSKEVMKDLEKAMKTVAPVKKDDW